MMTAGIKNLKQCLKKHSILQSIHIFSKIKLTLVAVALLFTAACAGLDSERMVAFTSADQMPFQTGKSIRNIEVRGETEEIFSGPAYAKKEQILEAATTTLRDSKYFESVSEGEGDLTLNIIVRSQSQKSSMMLEYRANITITYRFEDSSGELIWFKTYETEFSSHAFSGATRTVEAREGSVRENLASLLEGIRTSWLK